MAVDDSSLLPKVPPPRPAGRTSAIQAALRRFDGVEDVPASEGGSRPRSAWGGRPQWSLAVSASLVAVIGIPAALIAINDQAPPVSTAPKEQVAPRPEAPARVQSEPAAEADVAEAAAPTVSTVRPEPNRFPVFPDDSAKARDASEAAAPAEAQAPASPATTVAPPPPALAREPSVQREVEDQSVVVTGSRIRSPGFESGRTERKSNRQAAAEESGSAPDWVRSNADYRNFLVQVQSAIRLDQRSSVTGLIAYPLRVNGGGKSALYRDRAAVLKDYDQIFTAGVKASILGQRFEELFGSDQGVMIGNGAVWFDHVCRGASCARNGPVRITAINN